MKKYSYGQRLKFSVFGTSHGPYIGLKAQGLPEGRTIDLQKLKVFMARRAPAERGELSTSRREDDEFQIISGLKEGILTGEDLEVIIPNKDAKRADYDELKAIPRPGHADLGAYLKYGINFDMSGGGPFSARLTAAMCFLGAICLQLLEEDYSCKIAAHILKIGEASDTPFNPCEPQITEIDEVYPVIDKDAAEKMKELTAEAARQKDTLGCIIECAVIGFPSGIGGAYFEGIEGKLSDMLFSIPAVKGVDFGAGFEASAMKGSQNNDPFFIKEGKIAAETNNSGGILGGISIGSPILMKVAFKPPSSVGIMQKSVDMAKMEEVSIYIKGRHDPCVALRAVPVVEAAAAIALYDMIKKAKGNIYLIGMPGSGKTTVGKALSHMTGLLFFDTDSLVVDKAGMSIPEIFSKYSEEYFRGLEKEIISRVSGFTQCIIATGGGSVLDNDNRKKIKNSGVCVYIMRDIQKLASEGRPLSSSKEEISKLYKNRNPIYELMSDIVADNNFTAEHCAKNIAEELELVTINE